MLLAAPMAQADMSVSSLSGYSNQVVPIQGVSTEYVIYGGFAGTCAGGDMNGSSTCNSCRGTDGTAVGGVYLTACNPNNAYDNLRLHFDIITTNSALSGGSFSATIGGAGNTISPDNTVPTITANTAIPIEFEWTKICSSAPNGGTCATSAIDTVLTLTFKNGGTSESLEFRIVTRGVDETDTTQQFYTNCDDTTDSPNGGACNVKFLKGDAKAYIDKDSFFVAGNYPSTGSGSVKYSNVVFFHESGDVNATADSIYSTITNASSMSDISTDTKQSPPISDDRIDGLSNGTQYCFVMANRDDTGIVSHFTPVSFATAPGPVTAADMCLTPEEVFGLLDGKKCFIATAAFGSEMAPEVETFRQFRNQFLLGSDWGKNFVRTYYHYSPKYAAIIAHNDVLRTVARGVLWPLLVLVKISLAWGAWAALAALMSLLALAFVGGWQFKRRRTAKEIA
jgi:hypothetical protein